MLTYPSCLIYDACGQISLITCMNGLVESIRRVKARRGWSNLNIAFHGKVSMSSVDRLLKGRYETLNMRTISKIADACDLEVTLDALPKKPKEEDR